MCVCGLFVKASQCEEAHPATYHALKTDTAKPRPPLVDVRKLGAVPTTHRREPTKRSPRDSSLMGPIARGTVREADPRAPSRAATLCASLGDFLAMTRYSGEYGPCTWPSGHTSPSTAHKGAPFDRFSLRRAVQLDLCLWHRKLPHPTAPVANLPSDKPTPHEAPCANWNGEVLLEDLGNSSPVCRRFLVPTV